MASSNSSSGAATARLLISASAETLPSKEDYVVRTKKLWADSTDEWGNPLRPANLNLGRYKGGRRPIDIYWRISNGVNGAKMPGHSKVPPEQIWDLVNFVLALPYEPDLLKPTPEPTKTALR